MNKAAVGAVLIAGMSLPTSAYAQSTTVTDERGDIFPSWEISDIVSATVTYETSRITIEVEHSSWQSNWKRYRAATGGKVAFSNGRTYVITSGMGGRRAVLSTLKQFRDCAGGRSCHTIKCSGWTYSVDKANLRTAVSVPVRCFPEPSGKVKVEPFHLIANFDSSLVIDPIATTPWIKRG